MTMRCRYSEHGKEFLRPRFADREGEFRGRLNFRPAVKVLWDGHKTISTYHEDFIEIIRGDDEEGETK